MKFRVLGCAALVMAIAVVFGASSGQPERVEVARLAESNWERLVPGGKEVDAIYGDFVLRNGYLTAVVADTLPTRNANMTVRDVGGALIDLTVREDESDQLSAYYPGRRAYPFRSASLTIDGRAVADSTNVAAGNAGEIVVKAEGAEDRPAVEVSYRLGAGQRYLTVTTTYTNTSDEPLTVPLVDDVRADGGKEDMVKAPNGTAELYWIHDRHWGQAYGFDAAPAQIRSNSNSRTSTLTYVLKSGDDDVVLEPGKSFALTRRVYPGASLVDVRAVAGELRGTGVRNARFAVRDGSGRPIPRARIDVVQGGRSLGTVTTDAAGTASTRLPSGEAELTFSALGVVVGKDYRVTVSDAEVQEFAFELGEYRPGTVSARVVDGKGDPVPCKVEFIAKNGTPQPNFGPDTAEFAVGNLYYAPHGGFTQALPPGRYDVIISHGPEFDAVFTELTVPPGETVPLRATLVRSVRTPGWISSDFHSHSSPSGDNTGSQLGRVLNLVCEHLEFAPCTEHNRISSYEPHIERLKIGPYISTVSGMELTGSPLPLNHQNVFPLVHEPRTQDGGGPVTDVDPERQIERVALWDDRSEKLVQQNHPDIGWLFYDRDGDGEADGGYERSFAFIDVMEIHPVQNALRLEPYETLPGRKGNNRVFNWLQLLNQGFRIPGVVNTDAHYNFHGSGWLRNWIQSPTDDPAAIEPMDVVRAAEEGRLIMSNGPYLEVSLGENGSDERVTAGQDLTANSGKLSLDVRVQCANWLDVDHVFVLVNGLVHEQHDYTRATNPDLFRDGVVKFERRLPIELAGDAHVIVVAGGDELKLGPVVGPAMKDAQPAAISNPIYVDVDGGGFRPNRNTLGAPLPVKFGAKK